MTAGATVHVVSDIVRNSPKLLYRELLDQGITIATVPTAIAEALIAMDWPADAPLRYLLTGGDVLRAYPRRGLPFDLVKNYGPTECTCEATWALVPAGTANNCGLPAIGRPIGGVAIHLLDESQRPVPPGTEGEIWIAGKSVGRGYRNRPALTAARFRPDPFSGVRGARMYRTGDRGRLLANGEIAFCGRGDRQVKIGGVRIELNEIALALQAHADVATAIVTAPETGSGRSLIAHIVPTDPSRPPGAIELRRFLYDRLPRAYIPRAFICIVAVPLTRNGKIDFAALPAPTSGERAVRRGDDLSLAERRVADIVGDVIGVDVVLDDNFFLLGGQSLQATEVVVRCREVFAVKIELGDLFEADTIGAFAARIEARIAQHVAQLSDEEVRAALRS